MNLYRSFLFIPAQKTKYYKALENHSPDAVIFDLEDSVPRKKKTEAKEILKDFLDQRITQEVGIFIRVNNDSWEILENDLRDCLHPLVTGYVIPKIETPDLMERVSALLDRLEEQVGRADQPIKLIPLIESPLGIHNSFQIAASSTRISGMAFGAEDYLSNLDAVKSKDSLLYPRSVLINSAKANHIQSYDTIYLDIKDHQGYVRELEYVKGLGFDGKLLIHPDQITDANAVFGYSLEQIEKFKKIVAQFIEKSATTDAGVVLIDGRIYEKPHIDQMEKLIKKYSRE